MNKLRTLSMWVTFTISASMLIAGDVDDYFSNLSDGVSNQRVAKIIDDVFESKSKPTLKLRGATGANLYTKLAPSVVLIVSGEAIGTGSIISDRGLVITNWHVVEENEHPRIVFMPEGLGSEINEASIADARVLHFEKSKDLALLQIVNWNKKLPDPIELGAEEDIRIGLDTHAIGHPNGEFWTYTRGYISQYRPNYEWQYSQNEKFQANVIQTQTPINPGNSGGPLINQDGKLIGVNSFTGDGEGINFAVAFNEVKAFLASAPEPTPNETIRDCEPQITGEYRSKNDDGDIILYDRDCNDVPDLSIYYPDEKDGDTIIDHDDNEDGSIDGTIVDEGSDSVWDYSLWDSDFDGNWDLEGIHPDGEINPSSLKEIS